VLVAEVVNLEWASNTHTNLLNVTTKTNSNEAQCF